jgi:hypothetical protein
VGTLPGNTIAIDHTKWAEFKESSTTASSTKATSSTTATTTVDAEPIIMPNDINPFANETSTSADNNTVTVAHAKIEIQNGTMVAGWASQEKAKLVAKGFNVVKIGNAASKNYTSVKIYDFSGGKYNSDLSDLATIYGVTPSAAPTSIKSSGDILIILGQ